ncbi:uncharacterized protein CEXT_4051 [Caerostris extrusa]|uniref:Uncharacterized protein n=1 Tax=Caerostris extrusa TaxID=172846 RepID=A0AAV4QSL2_CAEEX|nr:uncharacterized protein CEXT_4051 [Caerostris extrusa]
MSDRRIWDFLYSAMLRFLLPTLLLVHLCTAQEHHDLKIAEKLAIPHHIRHNYEYPQINLGAAGPAANANPGFQRQAFSQPDPFNQPPPLLLSVASQTLSTSHHHPSFSSGPSQPARQTRFFNMYTQSNRPEFGLSRRQS